uniref:Chorein_N domain-containing protein n=1 Tax=Steinernema glaseri TaxID=37863 RepID=A0A1I7Z7N7_9BILA
MTSIIKNQIIKQLSKYARNVTPDQITVEILRGKSELKDVELNEEVLTDVLELPPWLRIRRAYCNRVQVKVSWTKLTTVPVKIFVDEIQIDVVMSEAQPTSSRPTANVADMSYGFANKVAEGMSLYVNNVEVNFDSAAFGGSITFTRLSVESRSPGWQTVDDLHFTRITDQTMDQTLLFKQVSWSLLRVQGSAHSPDQTNRRNINAPLRLITNGGRCRIVVKKNASDGRVLCGRIQVISEDLLWTATLPQVRSAIDFYKHILHLINSSQKPVELAPADHTLRPDRRGPRPPGTPTHKVFQNFNIHQTSFHLYVDRTDFHLCDDDSAGRGFPEGWNMESGAMQIVLSRLSIDAYPSTPAASDRSTWVRYAVPNNCTAWMSQLLQHNYTKISQGLDGSARERFARMWPQLQTEAVVVRIDDIDVKCVSVQSTKRDALLSFFSSNTKSRLSLPSNLPILHLEFCNFFYPASQSYPLPPSSTHIQLGPFNLLLDTQTVRWITYMLGDISAALDGGLDVQGGEDVQIDLRLDMLMPKIIIPSCAPEDDSRFPKRFVISTSTLALSNCLSCEPNTLSGFLSNLTGGAIDFLESCELGIDREILKTAIVGLKQPLEALSGDVWAVNTSQIWIDTDNGDDSPSIPLVGDVSLRCCVVPSDTQINIVIEPRSNCNVVIDHFQFVQFMRLLDTVTTFVDQMEVDKNFFTKEVPVVGAKQPKLAIYCLVEKICANLLLATGKLSSPYE